MISLIKVEKGAVIYNKFKGKFYKINDSTSDCINCAFKAKTSEGKDTCTRDSGAVGDGYGDVRITRPTCADNCFTKSNNC